MLRAPPASLSPKAACGGPRRAAAEALVHVRSALLPLWLGLFLFLPGCSQDGHGHRHSPPEVVTPWRVTGPDIGIKAPGWLSYRLHLGGQRHIVHMKVNKHLLPRHLPVFTYTDQGALVEDQPFVQNDCYYHGYVEGDPGSLVALSTCSGGFQGILQTNDVVYEIEPKNPSTTFEHLVYEVSSEDRQFSPMRCGLTDEEIAQQLKFQESSNYTLMQSGYKGWWTHRVFVEIAVVVDHNRYVHRSRNTSDVQKEVLLVLNEADNFLNSLDVDVVLMGIEVWTKSNPFPVNDIHDVLSEICKWKKNSFNIRLRHDVAHIFIKHSYGKLFGLAYVETVCNIQHNCAVDTFQNDDLYFMAYVVSHEVGHNLGMNHDYNYCQCGHQACIMFSNKVHATRFSNCSYSSFFDTVAKQTCLHNTPSVEDIFTRTECGNSVVEEGEECDCGTLHVCMEDPCCQANCTLRPGAACAFGLCCKDCQVMPSGSVCREKKSVCDLPEWCNGTSYHCPEDVYVQDGDKCLGGGYCYEKRCNDREEQCKQIFGRKASNAHQTCYTSMNTRGDRFGNCGLRDSTYVPCNVSDSLCGRVQCENVTEIPRLRDHSTVHQTCFNNVTCWGTDFHRGMNIPDIGEVKDGTECGVKHICIKKKCVPMSLLVRNCSPETCNMKGVCNNRHHCHCNSDRDPPDCLKDGYGGSVDSGPPSETKKDKMGSLNLKLLLIWFIAFFVVICFLILFTIRRLRKDMTEEKIVPTSLEETLQNVPTPTQKEEQNVPTSTQKEEQNVPTLTQKTKQSVSTLTQKKEESVLTSTQKVEESVPILIQKAQSVKSLPQEKKQHVSTTAFKVKHKLASSKKKPKP